MTSHLDQNLAIKWPLLLALSGVFSAFIFIFFFSVIQLHSSQEAYLLDQQIISIKKQFQQQQTKDVMTLKSLLIVIGQVNGLSQPFIQRDRDGLLRAAQEMNHVLLEANDITHFYFHDPDGINFLRVHHPGRQGDLIKRNSLQQAMLTGQVAHGVEMGPLGTLTLRVVMPWHVSGKLLGYIELGKEVSTILKTMQDHHGIRLLTFIDKNRLHRADWEAGSGMLGYAPDWDRFANLVYMGEPDVRLPDEMISLLDTISWGALSADGHPNHARPFGEHGQYLFYLPIVDMSHATPGVVVGLIDLRAFHETTFQFIKLIIVVLVMLAFLLIWLFFYRLKRVEKRLREGRSALVHSETLLNQAQTIAQLGSWEWDLETNRWSWSEEMFRLLGLESHQAVAGLESYLACLYPEDRHRVHTTIKQTPTVARPDFQLEHAVMLPDASRRIVSMVGKTLFDSDKKPIKRMGTLRNVTNFRLKELRENRSFQSRLALSALLETGLEKISLQHQLAVAIDIILTVPWLANLYKGSIFLFDEETNALVMTAQRNFPDSLNQVCQRVALGYCMCGRAAQSREIIFSDHLDERHEVLYEGILDHGHYCVPILHQERLLGVLNLYVPVGHLHETDTDAFMSTVANTLAGLIKQRQLEELLERQNSDLLETMETNDVFKLLLESAMDPVPIQDQLDQVLTMLFYLPGLPVHSKGMIWLPGENPHELTIRSYTRNFADSLNLESCIPLGKCLCGGSVSTEIVIHSCLEPETTLDAPRFGHPDWLEPHCCVPILEQGRLGGMMVLYLDRERELSAKNKTFLNSVASILSVIIIRKRLDVQLLQALEEQTVANEKLDRANSFIRKTFGSYMSDEVVQNILDTPEGLRLGGDEKMVTVLMTDLRGFTALSQRMAAGDLLTMLNFYLGEMTRIIQAYHGTIIEFLGDGILALFGAPMTRADDADRAVACALSMQKAMIEVNARNQKAGYPFLEMGAGISTGLVIAGNIGSEVRRKYGVVGMAINLAARIESMTIGGQVLISEKTWLACQNELHVAKEWQESFKGVPKPITLYDVIGMGGPEGIHLHESENWPLRTIASVLPVRLAMLTGKTISQEVCRGEIVAMGLPNMAIRTTLGALPYSNVTINLLNERDEVVSGPMDAKVLNWEAKQKILIVHLTFIPPDVHDLLREIEAAQDQAVDQVR